MELKGFMVPVLTLSPRKLPGLVGEELEDFVDFGVDNWLLGVPLTGQSNKSEQMEKKVNKNRKLSLMSANKDQNRLLSI